MVDKSEKRETVMTGLKREWLRQAVVSKFFLLCILRIIQNYQQGGRLLLGLRDADTGSTHRDFSLDQSVEYIHKCFERYKRLAGIESFHGKAAEVGPGDSCGVALLLLEYGCSRVDLVDRFRSRYNAQQQAMINQRLMELHPSLNLRCKDKSYTEESFIGIERHIGRKNAAEVFFKENGPYDLIVSMSVIQHLYDPGIAIRRMAEQLKTGGKMVHRIDLRDQGFFSRYFEEMKFLEVPDWVYPHMTRFTGRSNRWRVSQFLDVCNASGLSSQMFVTRVAGGGELPQPVQWEDIPIPERERALAYVRLRRPLFATSLRSLSDEDLAITGIEVVSTKPLL